MEKNSKYFSLNDVNGVTLDKKLDSLFNKKRNGFFIELGANNGLLQSNTAFFEKYRNWKGVLIEASPLLYKECVINRPKSKCYNNACVSNDYKQENIMGDFNLSGGNDSLMSSINGVRRNNGNVCEKKEMISVKARTLTDILHESDISQPIDLLSLDVEGYEFNVLNGLDFNKYSPSFLLIEIYRWDFEKIVEFLKKHNYTLKENFSNYNKIQHPAWDGTHNDFLFQKLP